MAKPDMAHGWTDEQIEKLVEAFEREYRKAANEMRKKHKRFLERFEAEKSQKLKALADNDDAEKAFKEWLKLQSAQAQWIDDMAVSLAADIHKANEMAVRSVNNTIPEVFAECANMTAFSIDKAIKMDTAFTLVDKDTVRDLISERRVILPRPSVNRAKDMRWNIQKFRSAITQGILQGESVPNVEKRIVSVVGTNKGWAHGVARTALTGAENGGRMTSYERAEELGIEMEKQWMATLDNSTRDSHRILDGQQVPVDQPFQSEHGPIDYPGDPAADPAEVYNCFIGSTEVYPLGGIERGYKRLYTGEAVTIHTAGGVQFTCTPNHPIMTSEGWVAAGLLHKGDHLVIASRQRDLRPGVNPDVEHVGTRFDALLELLEMLPGKRAGGLSVDFHGDVSTADVDVIAQKRPLRVNIEPLGPQPVGKLDFVHPDTPGAGNSAEVEFGCAAFAPTDSLMGGGSKPASFFRGSIGHALIHGLRAVPRGDSIVFEPDLDDVPADAKLVCDALDGGSFLVSLDDVIDIDISTVSCHVYNLQTESGIYLAGESYNGSYALAHNCRCTLLGAVKGIKNAADRWSRLPSGITYSKWKEGKEAVEEAME